MDFYSVTLGLAIVAAVAALGLALLGRFRAHPLGRWTGVAGVTALALLLFSGLNHVAAGHTPGSPAALGPVAFLREHPALLVVAGIAIAALVLARKREER